MAADDPLDPPSAAPDHPNGRADDGGDGSRIVSAGGAGGPDPRAPWRLLARVLVGLEAIAPLAFALFGLVQLLTGGSVVQRNETMLVVLLAVVGLALLYVAYAVGHGRKAVRTATLLWQALLVLALVPAMWGAGQQALGLGVLILAVVTGYATVRATSDL
ncbi:hypothetical protein ASD06_08430 [Angustibacter sp. Root456]|nr:hypothetical protein ASD06_08430 [Angustibacter sp. Root456]